MNAKRVFHGLLSIAIVAGFARTSEAILVPAAGWGYSVGNLLYLGAGGSKNNPWVITKGWGWALDPPENILSGRLTFKFDPSWQVQGYGWLGDFGADPTEPSIPVGANTGDPGLLQFNANPAMVSSSIVIDQTNGLATFEFDWGPSGFTPDPGDANGSGRFNFAGIVFEFRENIVFDEVPFGTGTFGLVGSPGETASLGTSSSTYMLCSCPSCPTGHAFCGEEVLPFDFVPVPEPSAFIIWSLLGALAITAGWWRRRRAA